MFEDFVIKTTMRHFLEMTMSKIIGGFFFVVGILLTFGAAEAPIETSLSMILLQSVIGIIAVASGGLLIASGRTE